MGKHVDPIIHSDECITNPFTKKCSDCKSAYHRERYRRLKLGNTETAVIKPKCVPNIIHSDACFTASIQNKCILCKQSYRQERYKIIKKKKLDAKISLRSDNKNKSKYVDILCLECKSKVFCKKELCKECLKAYGALLKRNYRQKLKTHEK